MKTRINIAIIGQLLLLLNLNLNAQTWDQRPAAEFVTEYEIDFTQGEWNSSAFYNQWETATDKCFDATDIASGYLDFAWTDAWWEKRVLISNEFYFYPYTFEVDLSHTNTSSSSGVVIRANPYNLDEVQNPGTNSAYNQEGVAFYPSPEGDSLVVQVSGELVGDGTTPTYNVMIPKPDGLSSTLDRMKLRIEDYDASIYAFINDTPVVRIDLEGLSNGIYSSGTIYDTAMTEIGAFTRMEVERIGRLAISQRGSSLRVYSVKIEKDNAIIPPDPPVKVLAFAQEASAIVQFEAPFYSGSEDITSYRVTSVPGWITAEGTSSPITIPGLDNDTSYTFFVQAISNAGESVESIPSNPVTPTEYVVPDAPTEVTAFARDASALVSFKAPDNVGRWAISHYVVSSIPGGISAEQRSSPIVISGLENNTSYTFVIKAVNEKGESEASLPSEAVTPQKSTGLGVPVCHIMPCCDRCKEGIKYLVNGEWVNTYTYQDISTARSMLQQIKESGINIVCIDMTNYAQWVPEKPKYFAITDNIAQVCEELNMQYFIHVGADAYIPDEFTSVQYWNSVAGIILERWANKPNYRTYGFGDDRPILLMFKPGYKFWPDYNSSPDQYLSNLEKFYIATATVNIPIPSENDRYESDGWGYRDTNYNKSKSVRYTSTNGGYNSAVDSWFTLTPSEFGKEVRWVSQASEYSIYGSYDDACDNIFWGIAQTSNAADPNDKYPVDDPYAYYNIVKHTLTPDTSGIDTSAIYYIPGIIRTGGEYNDGGINEGEWFDLKVNVESSGKYVVNYRVASETNEISLSLQMDNVEVDNINVPATGSIETWTDITKVINLDAGEQTLRLYANTGGWNLQRMKFISYSEPEIKFISPRSSKRFYEPADLKVIVSVIDENDVENVSLYLNEELVRQIDMSPYEWGGALLNDTLMNAVEAGNYELKIVATNKLNIVSEKSISIEVENTSTGIMQQKDESQIRISPNPTSDWLNIDINSSEQASLNIYNNLGVLVLKTTLEKGKSKVSIADLPAGVYLFDIVGANKQWTRKIIKN